MAMAAILAELAEEERRQRAANALSVENNIFQLENDH
jgi:hypothetical protein